jgi:hypothetical protein
MLYKDPTMAQPSVREMAKSNRMDEILEHSIDIWEQGKIKCRSNQGNIFEKARDVHIEGANDKLRDTVFAFF